MWLERFVSLSFLMISVLFIWMSLELSFYETEGLPGARFFPRLVSGVLIILTLYHVWQLFYKYDSAQKDKRKWD